jgi:signal transduction histidine kinase
MLICPLPNYSILQLTLIDAKKTYVRYISHELRTPLNSAFLGLKLLIDDFKSSREEVDEGRLDTARDVSKSVLSAVEILDGLLCVDSIENGIMQLRKQSVALLPFLEECIKPFIPQARECGISLSFHSRPKKATDSTRMCTYMLLSEQYHIPFHHQLLSPLACPYVNDANSLNVLLLDDHLSAFLFS